MVFYSYGIDDTTSTKYILKAKAEIAYFYHVESLVILIFKCLNSNILKKDSYFLGLYRYAVEFLA